MYIGTFVKESGKLKAIVEVENQVSTTTQRRSVSQDRNGHYITINKEKKYFQLPEKLTTVRVVGDTEYLISQ